MKQKQYDTYAKKLVKCALKSDMHFKLAAVVVGKDFDGYYGYNKSVISNRHKTQGLRSRHAEVDAIDDHHYTDGATLMVLRVKKDGTFGNAKPCDKCQFYAWMHGITKIVYTDSTGEFKVMDFVRAEFGFKEKQ